MTENIFSVESRTTYSITKKLPPCRVDKELLAELENFILEEASNFDDGSNENYEVKIWDKLGEERLKSIRDIRQEYFPDNITNIKLEFGFLTRNQITVIFSLWGVNSEFTISIESEESRRNVEGIAAKILHIINYYKTSRFYNPPKIFNIIYAVYAFFFILVLVLKITKIIYYSDITQTILTGISLIIAGYYFFTFLTPYTLFKTRKNHNLEKWRSWIVFASLEFIIFGLIGGYLVSRIIGK